MKRFIRYICIVLVIAMVLPMHVFAAEDTAPRASEFFMTYGCYLYQTSDTEFEVWFDVTGLDIMDQIGASLVKVQRSTDGVNWTDVKSFTKESYPQMIDTGSGYHACGLPYTGSKGYSYRAYVKFYAKNSVGSASLGRYTTPIKL